MLTRSLLRAKTLQVLYAHFNNVGATRQSAENELRHSIEKTVDLYYLLLLLPIEMTRYTDLRLDSARHKLRPTEADLNPNMRLVDNSFIKQLSENETLTKYAETHKLSWSDKREAIVTLCNRLQSSNYYTDYMNAATTDYTTDCDLWRRFFKHEITEDNEPLCDILEEMSIYWSDDLNVVSSFVQRTMRQYKPNENAQQLLPTPNGYRNTDDEEFVFKLLRLSIDRHDEFAAVIKEYAKNWDAERIAFLDNLIMCMALAELSDFPAIPVSATLNEYINLAKSYSTPRSGMFINGILDKIVNDRRKAGVLLKVGEIGKQ